MQAFRFFDLLPQAYDSLLRQERNSIFFALVVPHDNMLLIKTNVLDSQPTTFLVAKTSPIHQ